MLPPGPPGPPALYPAYALAEPPNRIHRRGYSDAGLITGAIALLVAGILAAYAFARLDDDAGRRDGHRPRRCASCRAW